MTYILCPDDFELRQSIVGTSEADVVSTFVTLHGFVSCTLFKSYYDTLSSAIYVRRFSASQLRKFIIRY